MANPAAAMAALTAQQNAQMVQQLGMQAADSANTHMLKMAETVAQGERARSNLVEKFGNDMQSDAGSKLKGQHDSLSSSSSA
jgi:hypothetical protein